MWALGHPQSLPVCVESADEGRPLDNKLSIRRRIEEEDKVIQGRHALLLIMTSNIAHSALDSTDVLSEPRPEFAVAGDVFTVCDHRERVEGHGMNAQSGAHTHRGRKA